MLYTTQAERTRWLEFAFWYHVIRPSIHFISKVTGALFFVYLINTSGYFDTLIDAHPKKTMAFVAFISYLAANRLEKMVSSATKGFAFAIFRVGKSWANAGAAFGSLLVLVPFFLIGAVTSYSGVDGNINSGELDIDKIINDFDRISKGDSSIVKRQKNDIKAYLASRNELRLDIENKINKAKESVHKECGVWNAENATDKENCRITRKAEIDEEYRIKLDSFDAQTNANENTKQALINEALAGDGQTRKGLKGLMEANLNNKLEHIKWVGKVVGAMAIFFEFFALLAALLTYGICYGCNADESEMIEIGLKSEKPKGKLALWWYNLKLRFLA
jgi:hypothetical protein